MRWETILKSNEHVNRMVAALTGKSSEKPYMVLDDYLKSYPNMSYRFQQYARPPLYFKHTKHDVELNRHLNRNINYLIEKAISQRDDFHFEDDRDWEQLATRFFAGIRALDLFLGAIPPNTIRMKYSVPHMEFTIDNAEIEIKLTSVCSNTAHYDAGSYSMCIDISPDNQMLPPPDIWLTYWMTYNMAQDMQAWEIEDNSQIPDVIAFAARGTADLACLGCGESETHHLNNLASDVDCGNCNAKLDTHSIKADVTEDAPITGQITPYSTECPYGHTVYWEDFDEEFRCDRHGIRIINARNDEFIPMPEATSIGYYRFYNGLILNDDNYTETELTHANLVEKFEFMDLVEEGLDSIYELEKEFILEAFNYELLDGHDDAYYSHSEKNYFHNNETYDHNPVLHGVVLEKFYEVAYKYNEVVSELSPFFMTNEAIRDLIGEEVDRAAEEMEDESRTEIQRHASENYHNELIELMNELS